MTSRDFCYWLQGFFELSDPNGGLTQEQADCIEKHLALVFKHEIDPSQGGPEHQAELNAIHSPPVTPESVKEAIEAAVAKLPKKPIGGHGPDGTMYRC